MVREDPGHAKRGMDTMDTSTADSGFGEGQRIEVRVVSDGWGRPREMSVLSDDLGRIVADYARRTHVIEIIATIDGREVVTPGPRYREFAG